MNNQIRIPASQIVSGSYTSNGEYVYKSNTKNIYKGYYFKFNGKFFTGKNYSIDAKELIPFKKITYNSKDFFYDVLTGIKQGTNTPINSTPVKNKAAVLASIQAANQQGFTSVVEVNPTADINSLNINSNEQVVSSTITKKKRYFFKVIIRLLPKPVHKFGEVKDEEQFDALTKRPNHITASITETQVPGQDPVFDEPELNAAEKKMPGLKQFLGITE